MSILRPYQRLAVDACWEALSPDVSRVAVEMATGTGKTVTFAAMIDEWLTAGGPTDSMATHGGRALVLVHTDELVRQAVATIASVVRGRWTIGVVKATQNETTTDIVVASVATLKDPGRRAQLTDVGLIVVDECHHAVAKSYVDILEHYGAMDGRIPALGFTATLARTDGQGLGKVWTSLAFSRDLLWGIRHGYLIDLVPYTITIPGIEAGTSDANLDAALVSSIAPEAVVDAWLEKVDLSGGTEDADLYKPDISTVLFAPLVKSAQAFADAFNAAGVKAEVVHGAMPDAERQAVLDRYEAGTTTVVCNAMVLTEGWNSPRTMCVIVARPTQSKPLFVQMIGRGTRPWLVAEAPPREDQRCIVLCVAGTSTDLVTVADLSENLGQAQDGKSLLAMADEWDIGKDIEPDEDTAYRGPVKVERWDAIVQRSSKAWTYTLAGAPYLPTAKRDQGYVFVIERDGQWLVFAYAGIGRKGAQKVATAPDLELAMALAEDEAQERGGDIGALLADKTRAWRKAMPSADMQAEARRLGLDRELDRILASKPSGKAGKVSDLISRVKASKRLDPLVAKIKAKGGST